MSMPLAAPAPRSTAATFEARCVSCNYGIIVRIAPERCPMCGSSVWSWTRPRAD
jgi:rubrerythrin